MKIMKQQSKWFATAIAVAGGMAIVGSGQAQGLNRHPPILLCSETYPIVELLSPIVTRAYLWQMQLLEHGINKVPFCDSHA